VIARRGLRPVSLAAAAAVLGTVFPAAPASADATLGYDPLTTKGSLHHIATVVGAHDSHRAGFTGKGVGIALIDTGVTEVPGLDSGNVLHGPDLSFDSQDPELTHKDAYGHGTHLASIMVGRDAAGAPVSYTDPARFAGIAPDARLLSVKVGANDGAVDVSQVIAGINWVVAHRNDPGLNVRVINLSYGTDAVQGSKVDPLAYAVENAWKNGIVVVTAGGNDGSDNYSLANPARDPYVLAVGADDTQGTVDPADDTIPTWGTRGTNQRHVDVVAPGVSVLGLRVPNGYADERNPAARVGTRFATASGTSQAAAVVSAEVALMLQENPALTPDQVKRLLMNTASPFDSASVQYRGNGLTNVRRAELASVPSYRQSDQFWGDGTGSLEAARGSSHVNDGVAELRGEVDIFGDPWDAQAFSARVADGTIWQDGRWRGRTWTGVGWESSTWRGADWTSGTWSSSTWRNADWVSSTWRDGAWTSPDWSSSTWRDSSWSSSTWREGIWSSSTWRTADPADGGWS
jgi:serine protease AprX